MSTEAQKSAAVWVFVAKIVVKPHFDMLKTDSIHLERFGLMRLNLTVFKAFLSLPGEFLKSTMFFHGERKVVLLKM